MSDPATGPKPTPSAPEPLELGDYVPRIDLPNPATRRVVSLMNQTIAGGLIVLLCPAKGSSLGPWAPASEALNDLDGHLFVVTPTIVTLPAPLQGLVDDVLVRAIFGLGCGVDAAIILDSGGRFAARLTGEAASPGAVLEECRRIHGRTAPQVITAQAPVIVLPNVITTGLRDRLLCYWQEGEKRAGTVARGGDRFAYDVSVKKREDVLVKDDALMIDLMRAMRCCVAPAMQRAFNFEAAQAEAFRIGCYPAGQGYFRRHRDNSNSNTNHRLFAISINLNEDYVGGELVFPEYGRMHYRPPACGAVIFSSSLLHEALDVTEGRRFATFSFFSDKTGAARVAERLARERSEHDTV
jgi:2OG-Fe(II) oxygenase superfamily